MTLGPGVYSADPATKRMEDKYRPSKMGRKDSNWAVIDRFTSQQAQTSKELGPGSYKFGNGQKWTKRTYNLKFVDGSCASGKMPQGPLSKMLATQSPNLSL